MIGATGKWKTERFRRVIILASLAFLVTEGLGRCQCELTRTYIRNGELPAAELWLTATEVDERRPCAVLLVKELVRLGDRDKATFWINHARKGASQTASADLYPDILYYKLLLDPVTNPHDPWPWQPSDDFSALKANYPAKVVDLEREVRQALEEEKGEYLAGRWRRPCPDRKGFWREQYPDVSTKAFHVCEAVNRYNEANKPEGQSRENVKLAIEALNDIGRSLRDLWGQDETQRLDKQNKLSSYYNICGRAGAPGLGSSERAGLYQQAVGLVVQAEGRDTERAQEKFAQASLMADMEKGFAGGKVPPAATAASWRAKSDKLGSDFALPADYVVALGLTESCRKCKTSLTERGSDVFTPCDAFVSHAAWNKDIMPAAKTFLTGEKTNVEAVLKATTDAVLSDAETYLKGEVPSTATFRKPEQVVDGLAEIGTYPTRYVDPGKLATLRAWASVDVYLANMAHSTRNPNAQSKGFLDDTEKKGIVFPEEYRNAIKMLLAFEGCGPNRVRGIDNLCMAVQTTGWNDPCRKVLEAKYWEKMRRRSDFDKKYGGKARETVRGTAGYLLTELYFAKTTNDADQIRACIEALDLKGYKDYARDKHQAEADIASARKALTRPMPTPTPVVRAAPTAALPGQREPARRPSERSEEPASDDVKERIDKIFDNCHRRAVNLEQASQGFASLAEEHDYVAPSGEEFDCQDWMVWDLFGDIRRNQREGAHAVENYGNGGTTKPQMQEHFEEKIVDMLAHGDISFEKFGNQPLEEWVKQNKDAIIQEAKTRLKGTHVGEFSGVKEPPPEPASGTAPRTETLPPQPVSAQASSNAGQPDVAPGPEKTPHLCVPDKYFEVAQKTWNGDPVDDASLDEIRKALVRLVTRLEDTEDPDASGTPYDEEKRTLLVGLETQDDTTRLEISPRVRFAVRYCEAKRHMAAERTSKAKLSLDKARVELKKLSDPCYIVWFEQLDRAIAVQSGR